jgi:hypothetical protein
MKIFRIGDKIVIEQGEQRKVVLTNVGHNKRKVVLIRPGEAFYTALFEHFTQGLAGAPDTPQLFEAVFRHQVVGEAMAPDTTIGFQVGFAHAVVGLASAPDQPAIFEVAFTHNVQGLAGVPDGLVVFEAAFSQVVQGTAAAPDFVKFFDAGFSHYAAGTAAAADFTKLFNVSFAHFTEGASAAPDVPAPPALLLDTYPNAVFACSFSRSLKTGQGGGVILRETNTSTTQTISAADIQSGVAASFVGAGNNGVVQTIIDQSGNAHNLVESRAAEQLRLVTNGVLELGSGGKAALKQGGAGNTSNQYEVPAAVDTAMAATNAATFVFVDTGTRRIFFRSQAPVSYENRGIANNPSFPSLWKGAPFIQAAPTAITLFSVTQTAAGVVTVRQNGVAQATFTTTTAWAASSWFVRFLTGIELQEFILWPVDYSANIAAIEANVAAHYGITL